MEDARIVELYWARSERAIDETSAKYGKYCYAIAHNILANAGDADESVNDTYLAAWNSIPPHRPAILSTFLGKIARRISIDKGEPAALKSVAEVNSLWLWMNCPNVCLQIQMLSKLLRQKNWEKRLIAL